MPALLAQADFVICLAPATPATENLMDADAFRRHAGRAAISSMRRAATWSTMRRCWRRWSAASWAAARSTSAARADQMPAPALARHPRVIATPHIGGLTPPAIEHQALETVAQTVEILQGRVPRGAVNAEHATRWRQAGARISGSGPVREESA